MREYQLNYREKIVTWVWERMGANYGNGPWEKRFGPVWDAKRERMRKKRPSLWPCLARTARVWADHLEKIDRDAIELGVKRCEGRTEMPTLPEFVALCKGDDGSLKLRRPPEPESDEARARRDRAARAAFAEVHRRLEETWH